MAARFLPLVPGDPAEVAGYTLRARLGSGGMGTVYLSFSRGGRPVAVKVVKQEFAGDPEFRRRFAREVAAAQHVQGHYTAPVVDADPDAPIPWLATAYIAGPSLQDAVGEHGPFPLFTVFRLLGGAAEGIAAVHAAGLIHRDLKPANVLLAEDGPRIIDFGVAHAASSSALTGKGSAIGTPGYMAPEQIRGRVSEATDVFGLGQLAVYAATGHAAFGEGLTEALFHRILNEPPELDDCPPELRPILARCLAKDPADRPGVNEVIGYARDAMLGDTMRVLDEPWLPPAVAAAFADYAPETAPPTVTVRPGAPSAGAVIPRPPSRWNRLLRPVVTIPAALVLLLAAYLGYQTVHPDSPGNGNPGAAASTPAAGPTLTGTSAHAASSTTASAPAHPASSDAGSDYPPEWGPRQFSLPGGGCNNGQEYPAYATFDPRQGPHVTVGVNSEDGDLYIDCAGGEDASINFNGDQAAQVSGSPGATACDQAVSTHPLGAMDIAYSQLVRGTQFCVVGGPGYNLVVLLTLQAIDNNDDNLTWSATAWSLPS
jgi:eukaryotic-like serine/threonine-protein kinase